MLSGHSVGSGVAVLCPAPPCSPGCCSGGGRQEWSTADTLCSLLSSARRMLSGGADGAGVCVGATRCWDGAALGHGVALGGSGEVRYPWGCWGSRGKGKLCRHLPVPLKDPGGSEQAGDMQGLGSRAECLLHGWRRW